MKTTSINCMKKTFLISSVDKWREKNHEKFQLIVRNKPLINQLIARKKIVNFVTLFREEIMKITD